MSDNRLDDVIRWYNNGVGGSLSHAGAGVEGRRPGLDDLRCGHARRWVARRPRFGSEGRVDEAVDPARRVPRFTGREATRVAFFDG